APLGLVGNHVWQSTLCAATVGLLTLVFRKNRAHVRYWLYFAASLKFLIPFAALAALGQELGWRSSITTVEPQMSFVLNAVSQPFSGSGARTAAALTAPSHSGFGEALPFVLLTIWFIGCAATLAIWWLRNRRIAMMVRNGRPLITGRELDTLRRLEA